MIQCFQLVAHDKASKARGGKVTTRHGTFDTPIFMPVGTQGTVKALTPQQLKDAGASIILGNTYHLNLRPGPDLVAKMGGLHSFMRWDRPILTDSGGFQVFSLAKLRQISDKGIRFQSHLDGREVFLGPKEVVDIQHSLNSDIAMVLDECPPWPCDKAKCEEAIRRTVLWAKQCLNYSEDRNWDNDGRLLFGIVQGSNYSELRQECAEALVEMDFPGYAIGGVSVGEPEPEMLHAVDASVQYLPNDKPRYVMGVGTPPQMLKMIARGIDMFDCVMPTREARHGSVFTPFGKINLKNQRFREDERPLVKELDNYTSRFSRAYLRHLFVSGEILGITLLTLHNVHFFLDLMCQAREHIAKGDYAQWHQDWIAQYESSE